MSLVDRVLKFVRRHVSGMSVLFNGFSFSTPLHEFTSLTVIRAGCHHMSMEYYRVT
jgi:hypothetical protein